MYKEKLNILLKQIKLLPETFKIVWGTSKKIFIFWLILLILLGFLPALQLYLIKPLIDGLNNISKENINNLYLPVLLLLMTLLFTPILNSLLTWIRTIQNEKVTNHIRKKIQKKAISLDMIHFEQSEFYDKLHRANIDAISKPILLLESIGTLFQNSLTLIAILIILLPIAWWAPIVLLLIAFPTLFISLKYTLRLNQHRLNNTKNERKLRYFDFLMTNNEIASEVKTFNLANYLKKSYWNINHKIQKSLFSLLNKQLKAEVAISIFSFFIIAIIMVYMVNQTLENNITIGLLVMFYFSFIQAQRVIKTLFVNFSKVYNSLLFLENLFDFFKIGEHNIINKEVLEKEDSYIIEIKNLYFKYPNAQKYAIENISLTLKPNQITAIVGTNGSGKSTLVKLLNAFYEPTKGNIFINSKDICKLEQKSIRKNITTLFQNFVKYHMSAEENIKIGDISKKYSKEEINSLLELTQTKNLIDSLPNKLKTILGKRFGGEELSGGEWQKIALSRAYLKNSKILILDEPTSALDSWAESKWLNRFIHLCTNKTALIITHKFTTAKHADIIHVMKDGKIVESGTHDELIKLDKLYAKSWKKQINEINK